MFFTNYFIICCYFYHYDDNFLYNVLTNYTFLLSNLSGLESKSTFIKPAVMPENTFLLKNSFKVTAHFKQPLEVFEGETNKFVNVFAGLSQQGLGLDKNVV